MPITKATRDDDFAAFVPDRWFSSLPDVAIRLLFFSILILLVAVRGGYLDRGSVISPAAMQKLQANQFVVPQIDLLPQLLGVNFDYLTRSDSNAAPQASTLRLFEDGRPLGPAHSIHQEIADRGAGRYSHWAGQLRFSSSDNSDPRTNGRAYTVVERPEAWRVVLLPLLLFAGLVTWRQRHGLDDGIAEARVAVRVLRSSGADVRTPSRVAWLVLRMALPIAVLTGILCAFTYVVRQRDPERAFVARGVSTDLQVVKVQFDRAVRLGAPDLAFVGDSSCLMGIDVPRLHVAFPQHSIESFCTLAFLGPAGYAVMIDRMLDRGVIPGKLVIVLHPTQFQRDARWDSWINLAKDGPSAPSQSVLDTVLEYARLKWLGSVLYAPLPGLYGVYYGSAATFEATIANNHGSAVDPGSGLNIRSATEFDHSVAAASSAALRTPEPDVLNENFLNALQTLARSIRRFGVERVYLLISPVPGLRYTGQALADRNETARQIARRLAIPMDHVLSLDQSLPAVYFSSTTHMNRWGRERYTASLARRLAELLN